MRVRNTEAPCPIHKAPTYGDCHRKLRALGYDIPLDPPVNRKGFDPKGMVECKGCGEMFYKSKAKKAKICVECDEMMHRPKTRGKSKKTNGYQMTASGTIKD
jgi:formylmethanofuran dehydrogenase subunit E